MKLLALAGRLLLEYNDSTDAIQHTLTTTALALTNEKLDVTVSYEGVVIQLGSNPPLRSPVAELRYNAALQARVHLVLAELRRGKIDLAAALRQLNRAEAESPPHSYWLVAALLGCGAACLALLLGADSGAALVAGLATGLGLVARKQLARRHFNLLTQPFVAALIGAILGGIAIRLEWTRSPALALIVPSLMLIPGPHLINGLLDLVDNFLPMSVARLTLAAGIVLASALGIVAGIELTLRELPLAAPTVNTDHLNLISDMLLAGIVTCGFAVFYNAAWQHVGMATVGGMCGHGLRFLALEAGARLEVASFIGGLAVGVVAALIARLYKIPVAVIAFAGAVTMMPGMQIYRAIGGTLQLAQLDTTAELTTVAGTLGAAAQACLVVGALVLGLILAARVVFVLVRGDISTSAES